MIQFLPSPRSMDMFHFDVLSKSNRCPIDILSMSYRFLYDSKPSFSDLRNYRDGGFDDRDLVVNAHFKRFLEMLRTEPNYDSFQPYLVLVGKAQYLGQDIPTWELPEVSLVECLTAIGTFIDVKGKDISFIKSIETYFKKLSLYPEELNNIDKGERDLYFYKGISRPFGNDSMTDEEQSLEFQTAVSVSKNIDTQ